VWLCVARGVEVGLWKWKWEWVGWDSDWDPTPYHYSLSIGLIMSVLADNLTHCVITRYSSCLLVLGLDPLTYLVVTHTRFSEAARKPDAKASDERYVSQ
jgi:hypothetical protein